MRNQIISHCNNAKLFSIMKLHYQDQEFHEFREYIGKYLKFRKYYQLFSNNGYIEMESIIWYDKFNFFNYIFKLDIINILDIAANSGNFDVVKWIHKNKYEIFKKDTTNAANYASANGDLDILKYLLKYCIAKSEIFPYINGVFAAKNGHLHILEWLHQNKIVYNMNIQLNYCGISSIACKNGHLNIIEWLFSIQNNNKQNFYIFYDGIFFAAGNGHLEIIKCIFKNFSNINNNNKHIIDNAAKNGHINVVKYLLDHGYIFKRNTIYETFQNGYANIAMLLIHHHSHIVDDNII